MSQSNAIKNKHKESKKQCPISQRTVIHVTQSEPSCPSIETKHRAAKRRYRSKSNVYTVPTNTVRKLEFET